MSLTPPFDTPVALERGGCRGGGVFLVAATLGATLLFASGCVTKGDLRRLQNEVAAQAVLQETETRDLFAAIQALQDSLQAQSAIQSEIVVDTQGGIARELRDMQTQLSQLFQLTGQIQRIVTVMSERLRAEGARVTVSPQRAYPDSLAAGFRRGGGDPADCDGTYAMAVGEFNERRLNTARMAFSRFLAECPEHRQTTTAQFNLGDILEQENRLDEAIEQFLLIPQLSPLADLTPVALYRIALIYVLQDNVDLAVSYLERVVGYPDSDAAGPARERLEEIR